MEVLYETAQKEAQIVTLDKQRSLYLWLLAAAIIAITALVAGLVLMVVMHKRKRALLAAKVALEAETKERRILARDLHDGLGGMLSLLRMKLVNQGDGSIRDQLDDIIIELRRTAHHLMPEELLKNGLASALNDFAVSVPGAIFQAVGDIHLEKDVELVLYRCAYELVNNALKHAQASSISIQLMQDEHEVTLTVSDNGRGIQRGTVSGEGMGLQNIRERIESYNGRLDIVSAESKGTDINIILPL
jgi:signal transduction histidine kinase